jgi:hypothetical protein
MAAHVFPFPELTVGTAETKLDANGGLGDAKTVRQVDRLVTEFIAVVERQPQTQDPDSQNSGTAAVHNPSAALPVSSPPQT